MDQQVLDQIRQLLADLAAKDQFSGVMLLRHQDYVLLAEAHGYATRPWNVKNTMTTRFRVASVGKMFTAAAILQLIEVGAVTLDTSVVRFLGLSGTRIPEEVTVLQLLTHTSGIADYFDEDNSDADDWERLWQERPIYRMRTLADYYPMFAFSEPVARPAEQFRYSGAGYILLGMIIEAVSGQSYFDSVTKSVFTRVGMNGTGFVAIDDVEADVAEGYTPVSDPGARCKWRRNVYSVTPQAASDGGVVSTAGDLIDFMQSLRRGGVVSSELAASMFEPHALISAASGPGSHGLSYGFASILMRDSAGMIVRTGHTGEEVGVSCRLFYYPGLDLDLAILGNQSECAGRPGKAITDILLAL